jgi:CubicO group peptidase (beta-lactamase class C family)
MNPALNDLGLPQTHESLACRLEEFGAAARPGRLSLALQLGRAPVFLDYEGPGTLRRIDGARCPQVLAGCLAKPLTASVLARAVSTGQIGWAAPINDVLSMRGAAADALRGTTFSHLMNHTHGLDASMIETVPRTPSGFIDTAALCDQLAPNPLGAPGELYSYSNAGAWLAAAALERLTTTSYSRLLAESSYVLPSDMQSDPSPGPCPATGGSLTLTTPRWLSFTAVHAEASPLSLDPVARSLASLRSSRVSLPGWSPSEQAACLGWKYYGEGWFGHTANMPNSIAFLRFNPGDRISIVMFATSDIAIFAFSCLFREYFPELKTLKSPRRLTSSESESLQHDLYVGAYAQAKTQIVIERTDEGHLSLAIASEDPDMRAPPQVLRAADNDIFFPVGKRTSAIPFIQFLRPPQGHSFAYVWNGRYLWKRR